MQKSLYFPLIGGGRFGDIEIIDVGSVGDLGTIEIIAGVIRFQAGPGLTNLNLGDTKPVEIPVSFRIDEGKEQTKTVLITATKTANGVELALPGGRVVTDSAIVSPVAVADQLNDPLSLEISPFDPFRIDESIFVDIFNQQNPQFLAAINSAQGNLADAQAKAAKALQQYQDIEDASLKLGEAFFAREAATALRKIADGAELAVTTAVNALNAATDALTDAIFDFGLAQAAVDAAQTAAAIASASVSAINATLTPLVGEAAGLLDDLFGFLSDFGIAPTRALIEANLDTFILGNLLQPIYDLLVAAEDEIDDLRADLNNAEDLLDDALDDVQDAFSDFQTAQIDLQAAEDAVDDALEVDIDALEFAFAEADKAASQAESNAARLEKDVEILGYDVPVKLDVLDDIALELAEALAGLGLAEGAVVVAQAELVAANLAYEAQLAFLPDVEFDFAFSDLSLDIDLQGGLEFNWVRATEDTSRDSVVSILYDIEVSLAISASFEFEGEDLVIDVDQSFDRSGRVSLEEFADRERLEDPVFGQRLSDWADTFDFV